MLWRRARQRDLEIAPDEIFLDASNAPAFDRPRFEGRLEKPLSGGTFIVLSGVLTVLVLMLAARAWNLQITNGPSFAMASAHNALEVRTLFAPRGVITDVFGAIISENVEKEGSGMRRYYAEPSLGNIIGYVSYPKKDARGIYYDTEQKGLAGLEAMYNSLLAGKNGQLLSETDALGRVRSEGVMIPAEAGQTVQLSIDASLQHVLARVVERVVESKHFIAGSAVIMDVHTGAVRGIVSYPSYDPNVMSNGGPADVIARYATDPGRPFLDHAVQGVYAPGSIVKPFIAAGALTDGIITPATVIDDPGFLSLPDPYNPGKSFIFKSWKELGRVDVKKAIAWSSDTFFYMVGGGFGAQKGLGIDRLEYWYHQFGLGSLTGIDVPEEASGLIPNPAWKEATFEEPWYLGDTYFTAIGQYSVQVTPIQMARATAAIANGGKLFTPTLLAGQEPSHDTVPVDASALEVVREGMRTTVTEALAGALNLPYVSVAAKTGTAQTGSRNQYDNSWVIGFFPYAEPQYAFAVVLERGPAGTGSQAVNVMRDVFEALHDEGSPYVGGTATSSPVNT